MAFFGLFRRGGDATRALPVPPRRRIDLGDAHAAGCIYVIGDIHGRLDALLDAEARIQADIASEGRPGLVVLLGDYVDRGADSRGVLEHLTRHDQGGLTRVPLCGNHDDAFLAVLEDRTDPGGWLSFGGRETLLSYGLDPRELHQRGGAGRLSGQAASAVPPHHAVFLRELPVLARSGDYVFVHAGVRPGVVLGDQTDEDLMWIREPFLSEGPGLPLTVVHGHTIASEPAFRRGRIGIDTGAYMTGRLAVLKIDGQSLSII